MKTVLDDAVLGMAHVALNNGRAAVGVALNRAQKTGLLLRLAQITGALYNLPASGNAEIARDQLRQLEAEVAERKPDPMEYRVASIVRAMFDAAAGPGPEHEVFPLFVSRVFSSVAFGDFANARRYLDDALALATVAP